MQILAMSCILSYEQNLMTRILNKRIPIETFKVDKVLCTNFENL